MISSALLLGHSASITQVREQLRRLVERQSGTRRPVSVLIEGETGSGKGLVARVLHREGPRARYPFVDVNCAAIPETLLEAELFGFERGAFTDARQAKPGLFQAAHRGVIFLDEIGLLPDALQSKLLKVLEEREVRRLGSTRVEAVDAWVLAATSEDPQTAVRERRFRDDLYHRLAVVTVRLPPLRDRGDDVLMLAEHFLAQACQEHGIPKRSLTPDAHAALLAHDWPGNVRELINVMERVVLMADEPLIGARSLGLGRPASDPGRDVAAPGRAPLRDALRELARTRVLEALDAVGWNITRAASRLGVPRGTLRYWMRRYELRPALASPPAGEASSASPATADEASAPGLAGACVRWEPRSLTVLRAQLDAAGPAAGAILDMVMDKVRSFGGRVEELSQTGVVGVFGLEKVEDGPRRAAHAAAAMVQAVERTSEQRPERIGIKVALHTDRLLVGWAGSGPEIDQSAKRAALDVAEALVASAAAQPIAVSAASHAHLARRFTMIPQDGAYRLVGRERTIPARPTTFAGRRQELALIRHRLESAARGHGQIVAVVGEPGMGKSRLIYEFRRSLGHGRLTALEGGCVAYPEGVPYLPVIRMLEQACGIRERDPASRIVRKIRRTLRGLGIGPADDAVYLLALFGMAEGTEPLSRLTDEAMGVHIRETLRQMYEAGARRGPLLLIVEDLQWIDHASERALSLLAERLPALPILLVVTYRPGLRPDWITRSYTTQIALEPLAGEESADVIHSILSETETPPALIRRLVERGGGNPFHLEELALAVREGGAAHAGTAVPASVQDVLQARIEQAPPNARALLQSAAVLGREVSVPLLRLLSPDPDRADAGLRELTQREFLCPQPSGEDEIYVFRHALIQEVAYHALPEPERVARHAAAGRALEALHGEGEVSGRAAQVLAYHFGQAGRWDKALRYLLQAAQRAVRAFATREAIALYDGAEAAAGRLSGDAPTETRMAIHRGRAELYVLVSEFERAIDEWDAVLRLARGRDRHAEGAALVAIGQSLLLSHRFDQSLARAHEAVALGSALDAPSVVAGGLVNEAMVYEFTGRLAEARQTFDRALVLSRRAHDVANEATALVFAAELESWEGHYAAAAALYERGIQIGRDHHVLVPVLEGLFMSGINFTGQGAYDRALAVFEEGLALAERVGDENYTPRYLNSLGWLCMECGDLARARELNARAAEGGHRRGDHESFANAELNLGDIALLTGDLALAAHYLEPVRRLVEDPATSEWMRWRYSIHLWASLSRLAFARGDLRRARAHADECLERATRTRSRKYLVKGWRLRGDIAASRHRWDEAEQALREALDVAAHIGNPPLLWMTHAAIARLWAERQRPEPARQAYDAARRVFEGTRRWIRTPSLRATFDATAPEAPPLAVERPD